MSLDEKKLEELGRKTDAIRWEYATTSAYKPVPNDEDWKKCPTCNRRPRQWVFDNGSYARCQCDYKYERPNVSVESIGDYVRRTGDVVGYDYDELRKNWNKHVEDLVISKSNDSLQ